MRFCGREEDKITSKAHDFILQMIGLAMRKKGYEIVSADGNCSKISDLKFLITPTLKRHRPDIIGYNRENGGICIGEAKSYGDISSQRTKEQLQDFSTIITTSNESIELIIGIPVSQEDELNGLLRGLDLANKKNILVLKIPDAVLQK
jgi:hypothetical protein